MRSISFYIQLIDWKIPIPYDSSTYAQVYGIWYARGSGREQEPFKYYQSLESTYNPYIIPVIQELYYEVLS